MSIESIRPMSESAELRRRKHAVSAAFAVNGLIFASFLSRTPAVADGLGLTTGGLGLLLLCFSAGAVAGLPLSGPLVQRVGPGRAVVLSSMAIAVGLASVAVGLASASVVPAGVGLLLTGCGMGVWDVAMNVAGADVERGLGRQIMPRLHAGFSLGTVTGAAIGAVCAATGVPLALQLIPVVVLVPPAMLLATRRFPPMTVADGHTGASGGVLRAWRDPRTLLIGVLTLGFAFTEGAANDWVAVAVADGYRAGETLGAIGFGLFVTAMTVGRLVGGSVLDRFGRVPVLRVAALSVLVGLGLVLFGGSLPVAMIGVLLWGLGAALGFPVGMSAAADDPVHAAARVSVVSSIGYTAFLAGPPLIGLLAEYSGILRALLVVLGAVVLALLASGAARPLAPPDASHGGTSRENEPENVHMPP